MPDFQSSSELAPEIPGTSIDITSSSVAGLRRAMAAGDLTATGLAKRCLDRIATVNPALGAVIAVTPDALDQTAASDAAVRAGRPRGPLEGIPVLIKDNVQVAGAPATAGSPALLAARPPDAFIVSRLREAGAIILAKANMSEWANFRSTRSTSGWSTLGGQTANPYALDRNPSGSSSGSAAGLSAGFAPLAVGTETDGSIVSPSSACGVVGIKPTLGLVSRGGIVPISLAQDTAGPMTRSVADAAALLSVLAAADPADPATAPAAGAARDYTACLDGSALAGARLGVWRDGSKDSDAGTAAVLEQALALLRDAGAELVDPVELPGAAEITEPEFAALTHEFKHDLNAYLAGLRGTHPADLAGLIEYNTRNAGTVLAHFGQELFERAEATTGDPGEPGYQAARAEASRRAREALDGPLAAHRLDAIVTITASPAWLTDYVLGDHDVFHTSGPSAVAGYPAVTVMAGNVSGLPVGLSFLGPPWSEPALIALGYAFEQAAPPRLVPSLAGHHPAGGPAGQR